MLLVAMLALQTATAPAITLTPVAGGGKMVARDYLQSAHESVIERMKQKATAHCGKLSVRWGRFNNNLQAYATPDGGIENRYSLYEQKFTCYDPATDPYKSPPADWKPSDVDKSDALIFAERHLSAMDRNDVTAAMAGFEPLLELTRAEAVTTIDDYRSRTTGQTRRFRPLIWANNPDGSAHPGAYAYAAFDAERSCGYMLLYRVGAGKYQVSQLRVFGVLAGVKWTDQGAASLKEQCSQL
jgi:hypothetical protein